MVRIIVTFYAVQSRHYHHIRLLTYRRLFGADRNKFRAPVVLKMQL